MFDFKRITNMKKNNLERLVGKEGSFIWVRSRFNIPESLCNQNLTLVIPKLHFSNQVWINGEYIGTGGNFPPNEVSRLNKSHCYNIPEELLRPHETNELLIKIWCHGKSRISAETFIGPAVQSQHYADTLSFIHSTFYIYFEGGTFAAFFIYFFLYIRSRRKSKNHFYFSLFNLAAMFFITSFYMSDMYVYNNGLISHLAYVKFFLCIACYCLFYFIANFILAYLEIKTSDAFTALTLGVFVLQVLITLGAPDYNFLMKICPYMLLMVPLQMGYALHQFVLGFFRKSKRKKALILLAGFSPSFVGFIVDIVVRNAFPYGTHIFYCIIGWQITDIFFLILLTRQFYVLFDRVELLNTDLENQVKIKTENLTKVNNELASAMFRAKTDMAMASIIQKKFFPFPTQNFKGWDLAITYKPLEDVSGDLYDYYATNEYLDGISLFDVSGHGIAASLLTMLSKDIIFKLFRESQRTGRSMGDTLMSFNSALNKAKGTVENYLTGLIFKFYEFDENDCVKIQMANAGHPYPILYSKSMNDCEFVRATSSENQYGSIGIQNLDVCFQNYEFTMVPGDIIVLYTDGLTEAKNRRGEQFQTFRLRKCIAENADLHANEILKKITEALQKFLGKTPMEDDLTIIVLKRDPCDDYIEELFDEE